MVIKFVPCFLIYSRSLFGRTIIAFTSNTSPLSGHASNGRFQVVLKHELNEFKHFRVAEMPRLLKQMRVG